MKASETFMECINPVQVKKPIRMWNQLLIRVFINRIKVIHIILDLCIFSWNHQCVFFYDLVNWCDIFLSSNLSVVLILIDTKRNMFKNTLGCKDKLPQLFDDIEPIQNQNWPGNAYYLQHSKWIFTQSDKVEYMTPPPFPMLKNGKRIFLLNHILGRLWTPPLPIERDKWDSLKIEHP